MTDRPSATNKIEGQAEVQALVQRIAEALEPERIILFGSRARGDHHEFSDIDLIIVREDTRRFADRLREVIMLNDTLIPLEPLVYTPAELERMVAEKRDFILTALEDGIVLYDRAREVA